MLVLAVSPTEPAFARSRLIVERAVLVIRHGIRAPLLGEVPEATRTAAPWPRWSVPDGQITPHGAKMLEIVAAADRRFLAMRGLLPATGCPVAGTVRITTNSVDRTIASGEAYARGFAPGCGLAVDHRDPGVTDPLFEPLAGRPSSFDAGAAIADINHTTGGMPTLVRRHRRALALLDRVLACGGDCLATGPADISADPDGHGIVLKGPIRSSSGIAQILLLQYLEGMPTASVGWGRAGAAMLRRLGTLHAALFAVFTRPPYMAAYQAAGLGKRVLSSLAHGPRLDVLVGHDTNVTALAAVLGIDLIAPGYAVNDIPPGGGLLFERLRDPRTRRTFVRISYRTQSPVMLRTTGRAFTLTAVRIPACGTLCSTRRFALILRRHTAQAMHVTR
ncbi:MAG: histidine-type phosphatase [Sphingomonas sp.]|nr:histidine-type phosphatase [Sphingomonas sp.]